MKKWVISYRVNYSTAIYQEHYQAVNNFAAMLKFYNEIMQGVFDFKRPEEVTSFSIKEEV